MKVLVDLNHDASKSYLLDFEGKSTEAWARTILKHPDQDQVIMKLLAHATKRKEIVPKDRQRAKGLACFVVSQRGYTAERLC